MFVFLFVELKKSLVLLEKAANEKDFKLSATITKQFKKLRKLYNLNDAVLVLKHYLLDLHDRLQLPAKATPVKDDVNIEDMLHCTHVRAEEMTKLPEIQLFIYVVLLMKLIDDGDLKNVSQFKYSPLLI